MTNEEIIAEFMGETGLTKVSNDKIVPYNKSYNLLWGNIMPVVQKIESLPCPFKKREEYKYSCNFNIGTGFINLVFKQSHFSGTFHPPVDYKIFTKFYGELYDEKTKIEAVYSVIVSAIKWYNLNQPPC